MKFDSYVNKIHSITLPREQAQWWHDTAKNLGLKATIDYTNKVTVWGNKSDIETAWQIYREEFERLIK